MSHKNKSAFSINLFLILFIFIVFTLHGQSVQNDDSGRQLVMEKILPFFSTPKIFENKYGTFRSPLTFYDGKVVETKEVWKDRRIEIKAQWSKMMGVWPPVIENQKFEFVDSLHRENFTQYKVRFSWTRKEKTEGYLLVPDKAGVKPAVITVYYEPQTAIGEGKPYRDFAYQFAKRGFITLSLGTAEASANQTYSIYYPDLSGATIQPLSMLAYAAANSWNVLSKFENVDSTRIGIMGHSFGGKWAMFASCLYDKFACAAWSDPGIVFDETRASVNYWEPWYLGYHLQPWRKRGLITKDNPARGLYPELIQQGYNLTELHALMAPRPFLVSGGSEDPKERWIALNHSIAVNRLLGYNNRVAMTNRKEHAPNEKSNEQIYLFFEYFLNSK